MRLGLGIGLGFKVNAILQAFAQKYDPLVVFGSDLVTYYGNSVDELFADHRKAWEDSPELVVNGGFTTNLSGWTVDSGASATWVNGSMQFTTQATAMRQTISGLSAGSVVRISWKQTILGGTRARVRIRNLAANADLLFSYYAGSQIATVSVVLTDGGLNLNFLSEVADTFQIDDVSVRVIDPTKLRLYQDSAGTTPVTAVEQFVGLVLDQSQGLEIGPEIGDGTLAVGWSNADARWTYSASSVVWAGGGGSNQNTSKVHLQSSYFGKFVRLRFTISGYSGSDNCGIDTGVLSTGPNGTGSLIDTRITGNGTYTFHGYWRGGGSVDGRSMTILGRGTNSFTLSGISVRELPGNHLSQPTATARPRLTRRVNLMRSTGDFTTTAWAKNGVTVQAQVEGGADKIIATTASETYKGVSTSGASVSSPASSRATVRFLAKPAGYPVAAFVAYGNGGRVAFDLVNGTATTYGGQNMTASVTDGADGFKVCTVTFDTLIGGELRVGPRQTVSDGSQAFAGDGVSGILLKDFDARLASLATPAFPPYQRVTSDTDYDEAGFPARLRFDGTDDFLASSQLPLSGISALSMLGTYSRVSSGRNDALWSTNPLASGFAAIVSSSDSDRLRVDLLDSTKNIVAAVLGGTSFVVTAVLDTTQASPSDEVIGRVNGVAGTISTTGAGVSTAMSNAPLEVGRWAGTAYLLGDIFALPMIVKRLMTPGELATAERAFGKSIGVLQ